MPNLFVQMIVINLISHSILLREVFIFNRKRLHVVVCVWEGEVLDKLLYRTKYFKTLPSGIYIMN